MMTTMSMRNNTYDNPTASKFGLRSKFNEETNTTGIKPKYNTLKDLRILCASCTSFDENKKAVNRVEFRYENMHALFRCPLCNKAYSEREISRTLKLDLPDYIYYDEDSNREIDEINKDREKLEKFVIRPINMDSPDIKSKRRVAKVIK